MTMAGSRIEAIPADHFNHCVGRRQARQRHLHAARPDMGTLQPRAVEQRRAAAELPARHTRELRPLPDARIGPREPLLPHPRHVDPRCTRYAQGQLRGRGRGPVGRIGTPPLHHGHAYPRTRRHRARVAQHIAAGAPHIVRCGQEPRRLPAGPALDDRALRDSRLCSRGRRCHYMPPDSQDGALQLDIFVPARGSLARDTPLRIQGLDIASCGTRRADNPARRLHARKRSLQGRGRRRNGQLRGQLLAVGPDTAPAAAHIARQARLRRGRLDAVPRVGYGIQRDKGFGIRKEIV